MKINSDAELIRNSVKSGSQSLPLKAPLLKAPFSNRGWTPLPLSSITLAKCEIQQSERLDEALFNCLHGENGKTLQSRQTDSRQQWLYCTAHRDLQLYGRIYKTDRRPPELSM